jgi:PAS domain S-box-containing protein
MITELPEWRALTGQSEADARGAGWLDALHPDDRAASEAAWRRALATRTPFTTEYRLRLADGSYRWYRARGVPVLERDEVREWVGTLEDIDEERRAEEARREEVDLVETLRRVGGVLASELDLERVVQTVTDESTRLTGAQFGAFFYNVVNEKGEAYTLYTISGVPREHFSKFPMPRNTAVFEPTFRGLGTMRSDDITQDPRYGQNPPYYGKPAGHLPVVSYLAVPVKSRDGEVIGGLFFGHAERGVFTERHERLVEGIASSAAVAMDNARLYEAERRARAEAEAANRTKAEFLASMSHELRTPLNAIGGYAELMELGVRGPVTDQQKEDLARIRRSQRHLLTLINDILNFARIEGGRVEYDLRVLRLSALVADVVPMIEPQIVAQRLTFDMRMPSGGDEVSVRADGEKVRQILLNLLSNAVKFTPTGGRVGVEIATDPDRPHAALVRVSDTGIGIPRDKLETVFDAFVQVHAGLTRRHEGTGLGLAISRDLARGMGGDLTVESEVGAGSTFTLVLPRG